MTRRDFEEDICNFEDLIYFCRDNDLWFCDDIYSDGAADDIIADSIDELVEENSWRELCEILADAASTIDRSYYLRQVGLCEFEGLDDDDFYDIKRETFDYCDENDLFEEDEDEEDEETLHEESDEEEIDEDEDVPEEDFSLRELFMSCASMIDINQARQGVCVE